MHVDVFRSVPVVTPHSTLWKIHVLSLFWHGLHQPATRRSSRQEVRHREGRENLVNYQHTTCGLDVTHVTHRAALIPVNLCQLQVQLHIVLRIDFMCIQNGGKPYFKWCIYYKWCNLLNKLWYKNHKLLLMWLLPWTDVNKVFFYQHPSCECDQGCFCWVVSVWISGELSNHLHYYSINIILQ